MRGYFEGLYVLAPSTLGIYGQVDHECERGLMVNTFSWIDGSDYCVVLVPWDRISGNDVQFFPETEEGEEQFRMMTERVAESAIADAPVPGFLELETKKD